MKRMKQMKKKSSRKMKSSEGRKDGRVRIHGAQLLQQIHIKELIYMWSNLHWKWTGNWQDSCTSKNLRRYTCNWVGREEKQLSQNLYLRKEDSEEQEKIIEVDTRPGEWVTEATDRVSHCWSLTQNRQVSLAGWNMFGWDEVWKILWSTFYEVYTF